MAPGQAASWGRGPARSGVLATSTVQRKNIYFGMEEKFFFVNFMIFFSWVGGKISLKWDRPHPHSVPQFPHL